MTKQEPFVIKITLPKILDLKAALPLAEEILAGRGRNLVFKSENVQRLGAQCLQVLLSTWLTWSEEKHEIIFENPSQAFLTALEVFGANLASLGQKDFV